ncbi:MAG: 30S ribosomal protein S15 [Sulfolobales archaeon]|nr:30S ribosomal protein S15 [Sulfolobales archaeon]MDW8082251.1 30S ribosomal protein S15 [Sulfolobales archaeon]
MKKRKKKGQSHSTRPSSGIAPRWIQFTPEEVEAIVVELAKKGYPPSMIGAILRDQYGVPLTKVAVGRRIDEILEKYGVKLAVPEDLYNLIKRAVNLRNHLAVNPRDTHSLRGLIEIESKIHRLVKYYKRVGKLPEDWFYKPEEASVLVSQPLYRLESSK